MLTAMRLRILIPRAILEDVRTTVANKTDDRNVDETLQLHLLFVPMSNRKVKTKGKIKAR